MSNKLPKWANWIARDKSGALWIYKNQPIKAFVSWESVDGDQNDEIHDPKDVYSFIKWEDEEPWSLTDFGFNFFTKRTAKGMSDFGKLAITAKDIINKPTHYHSGNIDVIKFSEENFSKEEQKGFHRINAIKYITRYDRKNGVEDLNKAKFYIDKLIEMEESE